MLVEARAEFFSWSVWILSSTFAWWQEGCIMWVICWVLRQDKCSVFRSVLESLCGNLFTPLVWLRSGDTVWRCSWCAFIYLFWGWWEIGSRALRMLTIYLTLSFYLLCWTLTPPFLYVSPCPLLISHITPLHLPLLRHHHLPIVLCGKGLS